MFENIKKGLYKSLGVAIKNRKETLKLTHSEILNEPKRMTKIIKGTQREHCRYLIYSGEYPRLNLLFSCEDRNTFLSENDLNAESKQLIKKYGSNYDDMLWGGINWAEMFQEVITELSEFNILEKQKELEKLEKLEEVKKSKAEKELEEMEELKELKEQVRLVKMFEKTLVDYAPYALIRYDELPFDYARIFISPEERAEKKKKAIERIHLGNGCETFKRYFLKNFSGKTLRDFDKGFYRFVSDYLEEKSPDEYSLGLQVYESHLSHSKFVVKWKEFLDVEFDDTENEKSILLRKCIRRNREHMLELAGYQQEFENLLIDIK